MSFYKLGQTTEIIEINHEYSWINQATQEETHFQKAIFSGIRVDSSTYNSVIFSEVQFFATQYRQVTFRNCLFVSCNFQFTQFINCRFENCTFLHCEWAATRMIWCHFNQCQLSQDLLQGPFAENENFLATEEEIPELPTELMAA